MAPCDVCGVRDYALCATLGLEREQFIRLGRQMTLPKGRTLMWEGQESMLVANLVEGALMLSTSAGDGQEQIVGVVYPSDFIGRPFGSESPHNVTALTDSKVCVFPRSVFDGFVRKHPEMEHRLLQRTLDELDRARKWMVLLGRMSAAKRVATFLMDISRRLAHVKPEGDCAPLDRFALPLDRQQIANVLGLTIETVSRQLSALKRDSVLALTDRRKVEILDRKRLEEIAQAE